jgi:hypothetical protein
MCRDQLELALADMMIEALLLQAATSEGAKV